MAHVKEMEEYLHSRLLCTSNNSTRLVTIKEKNSGLRFSWPWNLTLLPPG